MKRSVEDTSERFNEMSEEYDQTRSDIHHDTLDTLMDWVKERVSDTDHLVDIGAGTGMVSLRVAPSVARVTGLDISEEMMERGREKAEQQNIENVQFAQGRFRDPYQELDLQDVDRVVSNFAMHHLNDQEKMEALRIIRELLENNSSSEDDQDQWFILGDVILFEELEEPAEYYAPEVDDPSWIKDLTKMFRKASFEVTRIIQVAPAAGVIEAKLEQ